MRCTNWDELKKNRYYKGKQLNSEDFILEQIYLETLQQRSLRYAFGEGILHGLQMQYDSEKRICLQAGSAIDEEGRMLCVEENVTLLLDEIEGFDTMRESYAHVYIKASEKSVDPTFCALSEEIDHVEHNHILTGWKLSLSNTYTDTLEAYYDSCILYEDKDVIITQHMPTIFPTKAKCSFYVKVLKKHRLEFVSLSYELQSNDFEPSIQTVELQARDDTKRMQIFYFPLRHKENYGKVYSKIKIDGNILLQKESKKITKSISYEKDVDITKDLHMAIKNRSQQEGLSPNEEGVYLGTIFLDEKKRNWRIAEIVGVEPNAYLQSHAAIQKQQQIITAYQYQENEEHKDKDVRSTQLEHAGTLALSEMKQWNHVYISSEIAHGFGAKEVQIEVSLQTHTNEHGDKQVILLQGNSNLFAAQEHLDYQIGVKIFLQDGTFQIAIATSASPKTSCLLWRACPIDHDKTVANAMHFLSLEPSMIELAPFASCTFTPVFDHESNVCECSFSLLNENSGTIGDDGTYCAPAKKGLYQVQATSAKQESVYAYVHVKDASS